MNDDLLLLMPVMTGCCCSYFLILLPGAECSPTMAMLGQVKRAACGYFGKPIRRSRIISTCASRSRRCWENFPASRSIRSSLRFKALELRTRLRDQLLAEKVIVLAQ